MVYFYSFSNKIGIDIQCNLSPKPLKGPFGLTHKVLIFQTANLIAINYKIIS